MNNNSILCRFIHEHTDWKDLLKKKNIAIKESPDRLAIFNYGTDCDFSDPVVQESRGIIINLNALDVVCWPFRKFGNYSEEYADNIDWPTARVQEKVDGSIVKLWYNHEKKRWQWSTNSVIDAEEASVMDSSVSFMSLISRAENYKKIPFCSLNKNNTYIFELVAPEQKIVILYPYPLLYHIGTRSNVTGEEYNEDIGIKKPLEYSLRSLNECVAAANKLNNGDQNIKKEGFVVVDGNWNRIKVKSPEYVYAHRVATLHVYTKKRLLPVVRTGNKAVEELLSKCPDSEVFVRFYQWQYAELKRNIQIAVSKARAMYEELNNERKAIAEYLKNEPLRSFCFKGIGNYDSIDTILSEVKDGVIEKYIKDYAADNNK